LAYANFPDAFWILVRIGVNWLPLWIYGSIKNP
jgi:hypothetical protein